MSCPTKPLVSYRSNRQLSGWNPPPLVIRAVGAHWEMRADFVPCPAVSRFGQPRWGSLSEIPEKLAPRQLSTFGAHGGWLDASP